MSEKAAGSPTMRELATALQVSVSTVSLALKNDPRVALKTRQEVQAFAREQNYQLNPALTQLMSHVRSSERATYRETLAWLNPWENPDHFTETGINYYHHLLWQGAQQRAESFGYTLTDFWLAKPGMTGRRMSHILKARGIRGILIPPLPRSHGHLSIRWDDFSSVALSHTITRPLLHRVVPDHHANMQTVLRNLKQRGYKRPGLLFADNFDERTENRFRSAYYFHQQNLPHRDRIPAAICPLTGFEEECSKWLKKYRPDAVITLGTLRHLRKLKLGDPSYMDNLGIVLLGYAQTDAGFSAINENPLHIGSTAVDQLAASLGRNERGIPSWPHTVLIRGSWVEGKTLSALAEIKNPRCKQQDIRELRPSACVATARENPGPWPAWRRWKVQAQRRSSGIRRYPRCSR